MRKKLTRHGNSLALIIDKPILELLGIDAETELEITTDGKGLHLSPATPGTVDADFEEDLAELHRRHHEALRELAK